MRLFTEVEAYERSDGGITLISRGDGVNEYSYLTKDQALSLAESIIQKIRGSHETIRDQTQGTGKAEATKTEVNNGRG